MPSNQTFLGSTTTKSSEKPLENEIHSDVDSAYFIMEIIASVWFTIDYILRLYSTPIKRLKFILKPFNIIDLISNLPFYIDQIVTAACYPNKTTDDFKSVLRIFQILRILRVTKTSIGLKALGYTVKKSQKDIFLLICLIFATTLILTGLAYLVEKDVPNSKFDSIPACFYWGMITMTTV